MKRSTLNPTLMKRLAYLIVLAASLTLMFGCDDEEGGPSTSTTRRDQFIPPVEVFDMSPRGPRGDSDVNPDDLRGGYGDPCEVDSDCLDRACVPASEGRVCSKSCILECDTFPDGSLAYCRSDPAQGRVEFLCYPKQDLLCQPCANDAQCDGEPCVETREGKRCSRACERDADCPEEFSCDSGACSPISGSCSCNSTSAGVTRVCENANEFGACIGEEICDPELGWSGCDAPIPLAEVCDGVDQNCDGIADDGLVSLSCELTNEYGTCEGISVCLGEQGSTCYGVEPAPEICDTIDNDCDGVIDEDFLIGDGVYGTPEHCGECGVSCEGSIPYATLTLCSSAFDPPRCVPTQCEPGYQSLDGETCVPVTDKLCETCIDELSCSSVSPGARCISVGDPSIPETQDLVCGRDCGPTSIFGSACPEGFSCQALGEADDAPRQCIPIAGHCLCVNQPEGFSIPCSVTSPVNEAVTCNGQRPCVGDALGECLLPEEVCDGIDNDCDGVIDNQFRSAEGRYELDPNHCGRCNLSCAQINYPNAESVCDRALATPSCRMRCLPGFVDLENGSDDGCECQVIEGEDLPDGIDQNCDSIDGDVELALFVSKVGQDDADGSLDAPLLTISRALELAGDRPQVRDIYVATGVYSENVSLVDGVSIYGGYSLTFRERDPSQHPTTILGQTPQGDERATLNARAIERSTRVDGFSIYGSNAAQRSASSVAVFILNSTDQLVLSRNEIIAGNGAAGARGAAGSSGALGVDGAIGENGTDADSWICTTRARVGGAGGARSCGALNVSGGAGGEARCPVTQRLNGQISCEFGSPDTDCRNTCTEAPCPSLPPPQGVGEAGRGLESAAGGGPTYDRWTGGSCGTCSLAPGLPHLGNPGENGADGMNGAAGQACRDNAGSLDGDDRWFAQRGGDGGLGLAGSGGGGGSAGSGFDATINGTNCIDELGASGGGGGSGGCGGTSGVGGQSGGGSFAIQIAYHRDAPRQTFPQLSENIITRGIGGQGGAGGSGGVGGLGGEGAVGGIAPELLCGEAGGRGGNGGNGGHGGGGGGGCGGPSVSIYLVNAGGDAPAYDELNTLVESGRAGAGGTGGASTGLAGERGLDGLVEGILLAD